MNICETVHSPIELDVIVVYADLTKFARHMEEKSNKEMFNLISEFYELSGEIVETGGGSVIKFMGDAFISVFPTEKANQLIGVLKLLQNNVNKLLRSKKLDSKIQISAHTGPVIYGKVGTKNDKRLDVFGATINDVCIMKSDGIELSHRLKEYLKS